jgi:hypothetical protein
VNLASDGNKVGGQFLCGRRREARCAAAIDMSVSFFVKERGVGGGTEVEGEGIEKTRTSCSS